MKRELDHDGELCRMCQHSRYDEPIPHHVEFDCVKGFWLMWDDEEEAEDCEYFKADNWRDNDDQQNSVYGSVVDNGRFFGVWRCV